MKIELEHILLLVIGAFILYHFMGRCGCNNGFRVGAQPNLKVGKEEIAASRAAGTKALLHRPVRRVPTPKPKPSLNDAFGSLKSTAECNERVAEVERESQEVLGAAKRQHWDDMLREIQKCNARWEQKTKIEEEVIDDYEKTVSKFQGMEFNWD